MMGKGSRGHIKHPPYLRFCGPDHGVLVPAGGMPREGQRRRWKQFPWSMLEGNYQRKGKVISYLKLTNFNYAEKIALLKKSQKREVKKKKTKTKTINLVRDYWDNESSYSPTPHIFLMLPYNSYKTNMCTKFHTPKLKFICSFLV